MKDYEHEGLAAGAANSGPHNTEQESESPVLASDSGQTIAGDAEEFDDDSVASARKPAGSTARNHVEVSDVNADSVLIGQTINHWSMTGEPAPKLTFEKLPSTALRKRPLFEPAALQEAATILRTQRLLVVVGPPESGKATFAEEVLRNLTPRDDELRLCRRLQEDTPFDPERVAQNEEYRGCGLIVKDAFETANRQLMEFTRQLTAERLASVQQKLRDGDTFLVLTSDEDRVPVEWYADQRSFIWGTPQPSRESLERVLRQAVETFANNEAFLGETGELELKAEWLEPIFARADTIPKVLRFARDHFPALKAGAKLEHVLGSFSQPATWFLRTLPEEAPVAWCIAIGVLLGHAPRGTSSAQWWVAATIAENLVKTLFDGHPSIRSSGAPLLEMDEAMFRRARVAVDRSSSRGGGLDAYFTHPNAAEELWQVLFESGKGVLHCLLPTVEVLCESEDAAVRAAANAALGRIEVHRGHARVLARLRRQARREDEASLHALARFVVGVYSSGDRSSLSRCLGELKELSRKPQTERHKDPLLFALRALGAVDPELVVAELLQVVAEELANAPNGPAVAEDDDTLFFVAHVALAICLVRSPVEFCLALHRHHQFDSAGRNSEHLRGTVAKVLFATQKPKDGVFGVLQRTPHRELSSEGNLVERDRVVEALDDSSPMRISEFGEFLSRCFDAASRLGLNDSRRVEQRVLEVLEHWSSSAIGSRQSEESLAVLLGSICRRRSEALGQCLRRLLKSPAFESPELAALATRALLAPVHASAGVLDTADDP